jgi:cytochrome c oxidase subunit II
MRSVFAYNSVVRTLACLVVVVGCAGTTQPTQAPKVDDGIALVGNNKDALELQIKVKRWSCTVTDPQGATDSDLHLPVDQDVRLVFGNADTVDLDVKIAGQSKHVEHEIYPMMVVRAGKPGTYSWQCPTQVAKAGESAERPLYVDPPDDYAKHQAALVDQPPATNEQKIALGAKLYIKKGCMSCHTVDGSPRIGPSWKGIWGKSARLSDGSDRMVDAAYVQESILHPSAFARPAYPNVMPTFEGQLKPYELDSLVAYIESLAE